MENDDLKLDYWLFHGWQIYKENLKKILLATLVFSIFGWIGWALVYLPYGTLLSWVFGLVL